MARISIWRLHLPNNTQVTGSKPATVDADGISTIGELKAKIADKTGVSWSLQKHLMLKGKMIKEDSDTLEKWKIVWGTTIMVVKGAEPKEGEKKE